MDGNGSYSVGAELFGNFGVLLPIPKGQKGPRLAGWQKLTLEASHTPEHQALLHDSVNIGVLLGAPSGNLVDIDLDSTEAVNRFYELNQKIADQTLQTVGARGRHFFFRIRGPYPQKICRLEQPGHEHVGEWRGGGGAQTVIAGIHPSGVLYSIVNSVPVAEIEFTSILWPPEWLAPAVEERDTEVIELFNRMRKAVLSSVDLSVLEVPDRQSVLGDWCKEGDLGFIFGERGSGKTWLVGTIACYTARGVSLFDWTIDHPWNVLWIDGEMPLADFKDRVLGLLDAPKDNLVVLHHEHFFDLGLGSLNLADPMTQRALLLLCTAYGTHLLIIDNLSCLFSGMLENDSDEWEKVLPWLLDLRRMGVTVIIVHHASRSGTMRGTSKREDSASWIIKVEAVVGRDQNENGAKFSTTFTKQRSGDAYELSREWIFKTTSDGTVEIASEEKGFDEKIYELIKVGIDTATEIAQEMGCSPATVSRAVHRMIERKLILKSGRKYKCTYLPGDH